METDREYEQTALRLNFAGKILAAFSHELKNHLAVIKEHNGLINDLIELGKMPVKNDDSDNYISSLRSIDNQINKTLSLIHFLNRFSHRMDLPLTVFNVNEAIEELLVLIHRLATQRRISIEADKQNDAALVCADASGFQFVIFSILESLMQRLAGNSTIAIKTFLGNGTVTVQIIPKESVAESGEDGRNYLSDALQRTVSGFGWEVFVENNGTATVVIPLQEEDQGRPAGLKNRE